MRTSNRNWRIWVGMAAVLLTAATWAFSSELTWDFSFDAADVELTPRGEYTILSLADGANPRDAIGAPAIPAKFANILLPDGATAVSVAATGDLVLLASDITPYPVQRVAPKSKPLPPFTAPDADAYASADPWPSAVATFEGVHEMQGSTFVSVRVNPLVYVASEKALYYRPSVAVTVTYTAPASAPRSTRSVSQNALATEMVNALVVNPETADSPSAVRRRAAARASTVDYLIITSSTLSNAFQNLANYRATAAGGSYKTLVVTTNTIASSYSGDDIQMKIRNCISNYVKSSGTTYVVLGGDDSVVPDRDCYAYVPDNSDPTYEWHMPTDLYYSDLTGTWKASGNTNFGVRAANVDMSPDVIVGRIPVRNASQLSGYLAKVQAFEADTSHTRNSIIMGGPAAWCRYYGNKRPSDDVTGDGHAAFRASNHTYVSDSEMWNRRLFRDGIYTNWSKVESSITMKIACDSITSWDSSTCGDKALSSSNLKTWLNVGYTHFMFSGHGYPQGWGMETSANYSSTQAAAQTNLVAFVYTDACLTGAFDDDGIGGAGTITVDVSTDPYQYTSEPCLGEAFIRNANGGSLVHMGCARYGWGNPDYQNSDPDDEDSDGYYTNCTATATSDGGPSTVYAYKFYKRLYESAAVSSNRTVGAAFAMSKADMISQCSSDDCERWIQFGLNYLGDPAIALYPRAVPDAAPEFSSSAASTNGCTGESIYFDFSELLSAGSPAPTYTVSTSVSSSLYEWADGILAFTPTATGTYTFTCTAANGISPNATCTLTVTVTPPPPETPSEVAVVSSDSFTATWSAVSGASSYELVVLEGAASGGGSGPFSLVTSSSGLTAGEYVILADGIDRAMNNTFNSSYLSYEDVAVDNSTITTDDASIIWTLAGDASSCTLFNADAQKFVNPATSKGTVGWSDSASGTWSLSLSSDLVTVANAANTSWMLQYNSSNPRFTCYNSAQKKLRFFRRNAGRALPRAVGDVVYSNSVGNVTSFAVTGLQPETSYSYSVRAIVDGQPTAWSDSVSVTTTEGDAAPVWSDIPAQAVTVGATCTLDLADYLTGSPTPTISMAETVAGASLTGTVFTFTPTAANTYTFTFTASNSEGDDETTLTVTVSPTPVTVPTLLAEATSATTAYATWDACTGVTSYTLQLASDNQFTTGGAGAAVLEADFSDTSDWTLSGTGTYVNSPLYGNSSPALAFKNTGHYAISPEFSGGTKLTFWAYGNATSGSASTFAISGLVNGSWSDIETVSIAIHADTYEVNLPSGTTQLRFDFTKNGYNCALDDVVVTGTASGSGSLIAEYTVNDTEYTFTSLTPNTTYFARVKGNDAWSNVEEFTTDSAGDSAPVWSTIPPISVTVGEFIPNFYPATYVSGSPAPTITLSQTTASSGEYEFEDGLLMFQPLTIGSFGFTFTANNGIGSPASATLTVTATGAAPVITVPQTSYAVTVGDPDIDFDVTVTGAPAPTVTHSCTEGAYYLFEDGNFLFEVDTVGTYHFVFTASNSEGSDTVTVTVTVSGAAPSSLSAPVLLPASDITKNSFTINWEAVENADGYLLDVVAGDSTGLPTRAARDAEGTWTLVTDVSTLAAGDQIIIASATDAYAISTTQQSNNRAGTAIVKDGSTLETPASAVAVLTLGEGSVSDTWSFYDEANNGYLYAASSSQNHLKTEGSLSGNSSWSITIATDGEATVVAQGSNTRNNLRFNPNGGNPIFSCYADSSTMAKVCLYKFVASGSGASLPSDLAVTGTSYEVTGLDPETTYSFQLRATSSVYGLTSLVSAPGSATTLGEVVPDTAPELSIAQTAYTVTVGDPDIDFTVTATGTPAPTVTATCTEGAYFVFEDGQFLFEANAVGTYHFVFTATNSEGSDSKTVTVTVSGAAPSISVPQTSYAVTVGDPDVSFDVTATGAPAPTLTATCTEGAYFVFEDGQFLFEANTAGTYHFVFTATNSEGSATETVTVTVSAAPVTVPVLTVTNVTDTTALATWTACDGVSSYTLQLSTNDFPAASGASRDITTLLSESFESGIPTTWSKNNVGTATGKGGDGDTCLAFKGVGAYVLIGGLESPSGISFMYKRSGNDTAWGLDLYVGSSADGPWTPIGSIDSAETTWNNFATNFTASGTSFIKLVDTRTTGSHERYLDLLEITAGSSGGGDDPVGDDVQEFPVADTSYQFTDLTPYTVYYARVKGNSYWSGTEQFITEEEPVTGTAPSWSALPDDASVVADGTYELDLSAYVSGDAPITFTLAETELEADVVDSNFIFYPAATGTPSFTFTASNAFGTADATLTVTVTGEAPAVIVTPATYSYEVNVGDPYVEFTVTASGHPVPTLSDSCTEGAYYIFENNAFLFDPDTAGTYHFVFTASNSEGEDSKTITVTVTGGDVPLTGYEAWVTGLGLDPAVYPATATGANGHLNSENYICDISPLSTVELELGVTGGQVDLAEEAKSANRSYTLQVWTDLKAAPEETDLGLGATGLPIALDDISTTEFMRVKVTIP